jgi:hypothetical protein
MKFRGKPVVVEASKVVEVGGVFVPRNADGTGPPVLHLKLEGGHSVVVTREQARVAPAVGDYWVTHEGDRAYLLPREVFEHEYERVDEIFEVAAMARAV